MTTHRVLPMHTADFTIADVLAWARTKPADGHYSFGSNTNCALCQFLCETGRAQSPAVGGYNWRDWSGSAAYRGKPSDERAIPEALRVPLQAGTFGVLAKRLEALCPETPVTRSDWLLIDAYLTDIEDVARERCSA